MNNIVADKTMVEVDGLAKTFYLHSSQASISVFRGLSLTVGQGECVVLAGPSGTGKSTLLRSIYGNYQPNQGTVKVRHGDRLVDITNTTPKQVLEVRRFTLGYVSQFLRVIPRVNTVDLVKEPLLDNGVDEQEADERAKVLLSRLNLSEAHWYLPPATFSGGEQQRVNIARGLAKRHPVLLLDEPTASLDAGNRETVIELIQEALEDGVAMVGIFHDEDVRDAVSTRLFEVEQFNAA